MTSNQLSIVEPGTIAVAASSEIAEMFPAMFEEQRMSLFDLGKVTLPSQGAKMFTVKGATGEENVTHMEGVIVFVQAGPRAFYSRPFGGTESGGPPDCASIDGETGVGTRGFADDGVAQTHSCATCQHNAWGSKKREDGTQSKGKGCREVVRLLLYIKDEIAPTVISVPPTSILGVKQYAINVLKKFHVPICGVMTRVALRVETINGYKTSVLDMTALGKLTPEEVKRMNDLRARWKLLLDTLPIELSADERGGAAEFRETEPAVKSQFAEMRETDADYTVIEDEDEDEDEDGEGQDETEQS